MLLTAYIKYFFIMICSFYFFHKLLNIKTSKRVGIIELAFSAILPFASCFFKKFFDPMTLMLTSVIFILFTLTIYSKNTNSVLIASIISCGMSYVMFTLSAFIISPLGILFYFVEINVWVNEMIVFIMIGAVQILANSLLFKIKRLHKGMPFLMEKGSSYLGVVISIAILFITSLFSLGNLEKLFNYIAITVIVLFGLVLFIWWRKRISKSYIDKLKANEIECYKNQIALLTNENKSLEQSNNNFSDIIEKDNNIVDIMERTLKAINNEQVDYLLPQLELLKSENVSDNHI